MRNESYYRSNLPVGWVLLLLANLLLVMALEVLLLYRTPLPLTEDALSQKNPAYTDAVIVNSTQNASVSWYLVETGDGSLHLIPIQRNIILQDRGRIRASQIVTIPADTTYTEVLTKTGIGGTSVMVGTDVEPWGDEVQEHPVKLRSKYARNGAISSEKYTFTLIVFLAVALSILESVLWNKIKG